MAKTNTSSIDDKMGMTAKNRILTVIYQRRKLQSAYICYTLRKRIVHITNI